MTAARRKKQVAARRRPWYNFKGKHLIQAKK